MTQQEIDQCGRRLRSAVPILGARIRGVAAQKLAADLSVPAIPHLAWALGCRDREVSAVADAALRKLNEGAARDALCSEWAKSRDPRLGAILSQCGFVAEQPLDLTVLTALKTRRSPRTWPAEAAPVLLANLRDREEDIRRQADAVLRSLPKGPACDAICEAAIRNPAGDEAKYCGPGGLRHSDKGRRCLLLFVTRQLDEYFEEDDQFQYLRPEYDSADAAVRELVMDVVRSGDRRCLGLLGGRKALSECSEQEIGLAVDSAKRHKDWPRLYRFAIELPLKYSLPLLEILRAESWRPEDPDSKQFLEQLLLDTAELSAKAPESPKPSSSAFAKMLTRGREAPLSSLSEDDLMKRLESANPPEGVSLVAALAGKAQPGGPSARKILQSPHWMVRLAGHACGLSADLTLDTVNDPVYWVQELASPTAVLNLWPPKGGIKDLEALDSAPAEAKEGRLGSARKALRTLLMHHLSTTVIYEPLVFEGGEFAPEFEEA